MIVLLTCFVLSAPPPPFVALQDGVCASCAPIRVCFLVVVTCLFGAPANIAEGARIEFAFAEGYAVGYADAVRAVENMIEDRGHVEHGMCVGAGMRCVCVCACMCACVSPCKDIRRQLMENLEDRLTRRGRMKGAGKGPGQKGERGDDQGDDLASDEEEVIVTRERSRSRSRERWAN